METTSAFLHSWRTLTSRCSMPNRSATLRSCSRAMSYGFSRRCVAGASSVVTGAPWIERKTAANRADGVYEVAFSPDREVDPAPGGRAAVGRERDQLERVVARRERRPLRVAARQAEGVAAG